MRLKPPLELVESLRLYRGLAPSISDEGAEGRRRDGDVGEVDVRGVWTLRAGVRTSGFGCQTRGGDAEATPGVEELDSERAAAECRRRAMREGCGSRGETEIEFRDKVRRWACACT